MSHQYVKIFSIVILLWSLMSCSKDNSVNVPDFQASGKLASSISVSSATIRLLDGVYDVIGGSEQFGKFIVIKSSGTTISILTGKNAGLFVMKYGRIDSALLFEGYWRYTQGSETGLARFEIPASEGGAALLQGITPDQLMKFRGVIGDGNADPATPVSFRYNRPLKDTSFSILAHRGGGRNSDRLPESENSLGIIQLAEQFGANGIEIDVRLTSDGVPILFHDENFSPRLVNGEYCIGPVSNYTFAAIRTLCTLKNGERVPTLREALDIVISKTTLQTVWLDTKSPDAIAAIAAIQNEYKQKASDAGRSVEILIGLSTDELVNEYKRENLQNSNDALCELSPNDVRSVQAKAWAPRWTLGPLPEDAAQMKAEGRKTFVWTLDQKEFILPFITDGKVDGILTNYPALVAFEYYVLQ